MTMYLFKRYAVGESNVTIVFAWDKSLFKCEQRAAPPEAVLPAAHKNVCELLEAVRSQRYTGKFYSLRFEDNLNTIVFFIFERFIPLWSLVQAQTMGDDERGINLSALDTFK